MYIIKKICLKTVIITNLKTYLQLEAASLRRLQKTITCKCLERLPRRLKPNDSTSIIERKANVSVSQLKEMSPARCCRLDMFFQMGFYVLTMMKYLKTH